MTGRDPVRLMRAVGTLRGGRALQGAHAGNLRVAPSPPRRTYCAIDLRSSCDRSGRSQLLPSRWSNPSGRPQVADRRRNRPWTSERRPETDG
jgi:hypothetical protein